MFSFNKIVQGLLDKVVNMVPTFYIFGGLAMFEERKGIAGALAEQEKGYKESTDYLQGQWDEAKVDTAETEAAGLEGYKPYQEAGTQALSSYQGLVENGVEDFKADPGYQFRMDQGLQARERSASRYGNRFSGGLLAEMEQFAQGTASEEYGKVYNRKAQGYGGLMNLGVQAEQGANAWRGSMYSSRRSLSDYYGGQINNNILGKAGARASAVYGKYQSSAKLFAGIHKDMAKMSMAFATKGQAKGGGETGIGQGGNTYGNSMGSQSDSSGFGMSGSQFSSYNG